MVFFEALRAELYNDKVLVTIVCPGFVKTNISINAVTGTGTAQNTMDDATANGIPVNIFCTKDAEGNCKTKVSGCYWWERNLWGIS